MQEHRSLASRDYDQSASVILECVELDKKGIEKAFLQQALGVKAKLRLALCVLEGTLRRCDAGTAFQNKIEILAGHQGKNDS